ncbi:MAG TPA: nuclear transport factor 2 family protein [Chthoniobacterales bacterium]|jgi:ketosteroid isomerase-like protein|nr:nuclear transport factor 2 family protein [Chthoniobacterales bacterium]
MWRALNVVLFVAALSLTLPRVQVRAEDGRREEEERKLRLAEAQKTKKAPETPAQAVRSLVEAERNFYRTGQEQGTRAAFLAFLAESGIVFGLGPVNGRRTWNEREETGFDLVWEPTFAAVSRSADFGYDTGPAKWRANKNEKEFSGYGHFVSIWRKEPDGAWKVHLDCGIENPKPSGKSETLRTIVPGEPTGAEPDAAARQRAFGEAQRGFVTVAKLDFTKAFREFGGDEVRLYRDGSLPTVGKDAGAKLLGTEQAGVTLEVLAGSMSSSSDLAYYYGKYSDTRKEDGATGHFLQIWQTNGTGGWKLMLDWQKALPTPKP